MPVPPMSTATRAISMLDTTAGAAGTVAGITATGMVTSHISALRLVTGAMASAAMVASVGMAVLADTAVAADTAAEATADGGPTDDLCEYAKPGRQSHDL